MKIRRAAKWLGLSVLGIGVLVIAVAGWFIVRSWPKTTGTITASGLHAKVDVLRDEWGVPHLFAQDEHDLFFAQGFVHAQDRLWQMHLGRTAARGELSAMLGAAALESDRFVRTLGLLHAAEKDLALISAETRELLQAYCDGINANLKERHGRLSVEFNVLGIEPRPWEPLDVLVLGKMMSLSLSLNAGTEAMRVRLAEHMGDAAVEQLLAPYPKDGPLIVPPEMHHYGSREETVASPKQRWAGLSPFTGFTRGSNSWVVHGSRTATGKPLLANDTHLDLTLPSIWYENGLHGGRYSVVGFSMPGAPFVVMGHNRQIAWGITNLCADVEDLYIEKLDSAEAPTRYEYQGAWRDLTFVTETIAVKGQPAVTLKVPHTLHGPLVNEAFSLKGRAPVSLRWTALEGGRLFEALAALDRAGEWQPFREALSRWDTPSLNFTYADVAGNIGYQATGQIPIRAANHSGSVPVSGSTAEFEWRGLIPFDELPSVLNPPEGYIVTANNRVVPDAYPYSLTHDWGDPYRARRITDRLADNSHASFADMRQLQGDTFSLPAQALVPYLLTVKPMTETETRALALVRGWDFRFDMNSVAASVYYAWYSNLLPDIIGDEVGDELMKDYKGVAFGETPMFTQMLADPNHRWFDDIKTPEHETRDVILRRAFSEGIALLQKNYGSDVSQWTWGRLHTMTFVHQPFGQSGIWPLEKLFNTRSIQAAGEGFAVNATQPSTDDPFVVAFGPSQRFIADLSNLEGSVSSTTTGQTEQLFHKHRDDQMQQWSLVNPHPMRFERPGVEAHPTDHLMLEPASP